ncbi:MAG: hypothetical protein Q4G35_06625 [Propionibacteriaceae bacterium]|nr:hypothetical protein [Propionibacteriaceae bacterium]
MKFTREGLLTLLIVVAALFVGSRVVQLIPSSDEQFGRPFEHHAAVGEATEIRTGTVKVTGFDSAVEIEGHGAVAASTALFLVVDFEWLAKDQPHLFSVTEIVLQAADGRRFGGPAPVVAACLPGQPHIKLACQAPFEVPADALEGATLRMPAATHTERDDVVIVDLGIDAARAAELAKPKDRIKMTGAVELP